MSASWSSSPEIPGMSMSTWAMRGLLLLLGLWGCEQRETYEVHAVPVVNESPHPYPLCIETLLTAQSRAGCLIQDYLEASSDMTRGWRLREAARSGYALAEESFAQGRYFDAWNLFTQSESCMPSYHALVREGDAAFYTFGITIISEESQVAVEASGCVKVGHMGFEAIIVPTYETALLFYPFELEQTGVQVPRHELERTRRKADCMRRLAQRYSHLLEPCVERSLIKKCVEDPD